MMVNFLHQVENYQILGFKILKYIKVIEAHKFSEINNISFFSKNNDLFISVAHFYGKNTIWNYHNKKLIQENNYKLEIRSIGFSPDRNFLLSGSYAHIIKLFDVNNDFTLLDTQEHEDKVVST